MHVLLSKGGDPNKKMVKCDGEMRTLLYFAASHGSIEDCKTLLAFGARQDIDTGGGEIS